MTLEEKTYNGTLLSVAHRDYEKDLAKYSYFKIQDYALSEDLVSDTFMKTWSYLAKGGKIDIMKAFLYHILNNLIIDEYRKRKHKTTSLDTLIEGGFEPSMNDSESLFNILDGKTDSLLIRHLPKTYQKVMHMRHMQDSSLAEISLETGQSKNTVAVQLHRGLEKLKVLYSPVKIAV
ncbi:MAG: RNA polymerase sigma factor [bacterium]|nr:RNA polymerase sigma factor [bacterium]